MRWTRGGRSPGPGRTARARGRSWPRLLLVIGLFVVLGGAVAERERRRFCRELELARQEIARDAWGAALPRLEALSRSRPDWSAGEVDYWLGLGHWNAGRHQAALTSFRRVPGGSDFEVLARTFEAEDLLINFQFRAAEDRLLALSRSRKPVPSRVTMLLVRLGRAEARYDEVRI